MSDQLADEIAIAAAVWDTPHVTHFNSVCFGKFGLALAAVPFPSDPEEQFAMWIEAKGTETFSEWLERVRP